MNDYILVLIGTGITFLATILGAFIVFFIGKISPYFNKICMGLASGIMIASAIWSLILPALEDGTFLAVLLGLIMGMLFLIILNIIISKINKHNWFNSSKMSMLFFAVTLHNIPEGMAVGLAFVLANHSTLGVAGAFALTIGVAVQNIPEGAAISLPLYQNGVSKKKAFFMGAISGGVEPIGGLLMVFMYQLLANLLPFFLSFAAGAMIYVVADELIPDSHDDKIPIGAISFMVGFLIMMSLDVLLG